MGDPIRPVWEPLPAMSAPRCHPAVVDFRKHLYVFGGHEDCFASEVLSSAERFDLESGVWAPLPPMPTARSKPLVTIVGSQLFVCGGWHGNQHSVCIERFNPSTCAWEILPPVTGPTDSLCTSRSQFTAIVSAC